MNLYTARGTHQILSAVTAVGLLLLTACGSLSAEDLTTISKLGPSPTPVADTIAMFGGNPSGDGVYAASGPLFAATEKWKFPVVGDVTSPPVVSGGSIFFGAGTDTPNRRFYLYSVDARTQKERWRFATGGSVYSAPAISDGVVFFGSADRHLYALDAATGQEKWRFKAGGGLWASPVVADETVFFTAADGILYALDTMTGEERWKFEVFGRTNMVGFESGTWLSPSVYEGTVYAGSLDWHLYAIDATTGQEKWRFKTKGPVWGSPAVSGGVAYVGSDDLTLYAVDVDTGVEKWRFKTHWPLKASPVVIDGTVVLHRGYVHGLDADTGQEKWRTDLIAQRSSAQPIISRGHGLVYLTGRRDVYAIDVDSGNVWWETRVDGRLTGFLTVEDGALYLGVQDGSEAYLLALE